MDGDRRSRLGVLGVRERLLAVARGDAAVDLLLTGGRVVDVFTGSVIDADVAVITLTRSWRCRSLLSR